MSDTSAPQQENNSLDADTVAAFLRRHPDFFVTHGDVLADIRLPDANSGKTVSLTERQLTVLRERNVELRERLNSLLSIARDNDVIFEKTRALILALLEADSIGTLAAATSRSLLEDFAMSAMSMLMFSPRESELPATGVRAITAAEAEDCIGDLVRGQRVVCGVLRREELQFLFGDAADGVGSAAIVPLAFHDRIGLLAIGSRDPQHFRSGMDTLFVTHIGEVLARRIVALRAISGATGRAHTGNG